MRLLNRDLISKYRAKLIGISTIRNNYRVPIFVTEMYMVPKKLKSEQMGLKPILLSLLVAALLMYITRKPMPSYFFLVIPVLYILTSLIGTVFFGAISLNPICSTLVFLNIYIL